MSATPAFISTPRLAAVNVASANTALDGSGVITTLIAGVAAGTRVLEIDAQCAASSAASLVNIFLSLDSGSTWKLLDQIAIAAATASATVKANRNVATYTNLILPGTTAVLGVATTIAQSVNVVAMAGDLT